MLRHSSQEILLLNRFDDNSPTQKWHIQTSALWGLITAGAGVKLEQINVQTNTHSHFSPTPQVKQIKINAQMDIPKYNIMLIFFSIFFSFQQNSAFEYRDAYHFIAVGLIKNSVVINP